MNRFTVEIKLGDGGLQTAAEIAEALNDLAHKLQYGQDLNNQADPTKWDAFDRKGGVRVLGNAVGKWEIAEVPAVDPRPFATLSNDGLDAGLHYSFISLNEYNAEVQHRLAAGRWRVSTAPWGPVEIVSNPGPAAMLRNAHVVPERETKFFSATDPNCTACKELGFACIDHEEEVSK